MNARAGLAAVIAVGLCACTKSTAPSVSEAPDTASRSGHSVAAPASALPARAPVVSAGTGLSNNELPAGEAPLNWILARDAAITVTNQSGGGTAVRITGSLIPPPCASSDLTLTFQAPGRTTEVVVLSNGSLGEQFSLPYLVPVGVSLRIALRASTSGCTIMSDHRTFFGGIRSLAVEGG